MVEVVFTKLTYALSGNGYIVVFVSFLCGVLSILLNPCYLAFIPVIIGFLGTQEDKIRIKKAFFPSFLFLTEILFSIAFIGIITGMAEMIVGDAGIWGNLWVAAVFIVVGLNLFDIFNINFLNSWQLEYEKKNIVQLLFWT